MRNALSTARPRIATAPRPRPRFISATVSRSSATALSVVRESPGTGWFAASSVPAFSSRATAASASPMVTAPGFQARAAVSRFVRENTASRSERCSTAHSAARSGAFSFVCVVPTRPSAWASDSRSAVLPASCCAALAASPRGSKPISAACLCQLSRSASLSTSRLWARVTRAARCARRWSCAGSPTPCIAIAASISARRVENASMTGRATPAISKRPSAWVFSMP